MKIKLHSALFTLCLGLVACLATTDAFAQDGTYSVDAPVVYDTDAEREKSVYTTPADADTQSAHKIHIPAAKDTATTRMPAHRAATSKATDAPKSKTTSSSQGDDSILSFNFLYYLFEKYKMQDIVD